MSCAPFRTESPSQEEIPSELRELMDRVRILPDRARQVIEPLVEEVLEQARFRGRIITVARDALEQLRLELELARFDLDATRREREQFRKLLDENFA